MQNFCQMETGCIIMEFEAKGIPWLCNPPPPFDKNSALEWWRPPFFWLNCPFWQFIFIFPFLQIRMMRQNGQSSQTNGGRNHSNAEFSSNGGGLHNHGIPLASNSTHFTNSTNLTVPSFTTSSVNSTSLAPAHQQNFQQFQQNNSGIQIKDSEIVWIPPISSNIPYVTCSWHVFTNSESTNLQIFFTRFFLFSFKRRSNSSIEVKKWIYI